MVLSPDQIPDVIKQEWASERAKVLKEIEAFGLVVADVVDTSLIKGDIFIEIDDWQALKAEVKE